MMFYAPVNRCGYIRAIGEGEREGETDRETDRQRRGGEGGQTDRQRGRGEREKGIDE